MLYDLLRDARGYHIYPRGTAARGKYICTLPEWYCQSKGWLPCA